MSLLNYNNTINKNGHLKCHRTLLIIVLKLTKLFFLTFFFDVLKLNFTFFLFRERRSFCRNDQLKYVDVQQKEKPLFSRRDTLQYAKGQCSPLLCQTRSQDRWGPPKVAPTHSPIYPKFLSRQLHLKKNEYDIKVQTLYFNKLSLSPIMQMQFTCQLNQ